MMKYDKIKSYLGDIFIFWHSGIPKHSLKTSLNKINEFALNFGRLVHAVVFQRVNPSSAELESNAWKDLKSKM